MKNRMTTPRETTIYANGGLRGATIVSPQGSLPTPELLPRRASGGLRHMNTRCLRFASALLLAGAGCVGSVESLPSQPGASPPGSGPSAGGPTDPGGPANPATGPAPTIPTGPGAPAGECRESAPQVTA